MALAPERFHPPPAARAPARRRDDCTGSAARPPDPGALSRAVRPLLSSAILRHAILRQAILRHAMLCQAILCDAGRPRLTPSAPDSRRPSFAAPTGLPLNSGRLARRPHACALPCPGTAGC